MFTFPALPAQLRLDAGVYDGVQVEVLAPLEALPARAAHVRPLRVVAQLVALQVLFAF